MVEWNRKYGTSDHVENRRAGPAGKQARARALTRKMRKGVQREWLAEMDIDTSTAVLRRQTRGGRAASDPLFWAMHPNRDRDPDPNVPLEGPYFER